MYVGRNSRAFIKGQRDLIGHYKRLESSQRAVRSRCESPMEIFTFFSGLFAYISQV